MRRAVTDLTREILSLQAQGGVEQARALMAKYGVVRPDVQRVLDRLTAVPVDIEPRFLTAEALAR
jgi:hypothetical protein